VKSKPVVHELCAVAIAAIAAAAPVPVKAQDLEEVLVAGWDFSQYVVAGFLSIDNATLTNVLDPNHSDLDPTNACGIESNAFGTMHLDGLFGSTSTPLSFEEGVDPFVPVAAPGTNDLLSNADQAFLNYSFSPGACVQQQSELMPGANCSTFGMLAQDPVNVVFEANRGTQAPGSWYLSFAARSRLEGASTITVFFSPNGAGYANLGTATVDAVDQEFNFDLGASGSSTAYVLLHFPGAEPGAEPIVDNVGISVVPEPAGASLAAALALGALAIARRRA
jgi:hypothetical protein